VIESASLYDTFADLLKYPGEDYPQTVESCRQALEEVNTEAAGYLAGFAEQIRGWDTTQLQELFVRTFDLNPVCALEVGWHLFGDTYDRGTFMVKMREELSRYGVSESSEVPDHLTHVLALLGRMKPEEADPFAASAVLPAMEKMLAGLEGKKSPYENILRAIRCVLVGHHASAIQEVKHE
jgi:nitrate reductase delta subunit